MIAPAVQPRPLTSRYFTNCWCTAVTRKYMIGIKVTLQNKKTSKVCKFLDCPENFAIKFVIIGGLLTLPINYIITLRSCQPFIFG